MPFRPTDCRGATLKWLELLLVLAPVVSGNTFISVRDLGAKGDGVTKDTGAIQASIDKAARDGGIVSFPPGSYLSGTIHLRSNVTVRIERGAIVLLSPDDNDFDPYELLPYYPAYAAKYHPAPAIPVDAPPARRRRLAAPTAYDDEETNYFHYALFAGDGVQNVTLEGDGAIEGNRDRRYGPKPVAFKNCEWITIRGITIRDAPNYAVSLGGTDHVGIDGVKILNAFADGIDPDGCHFVRIVNSYIDSHDDAICPKSSWALGKPRSVEHLVVANCILRSAANCFKFGSESAGDLRNVAVTNCVMKKRDAERAPKSGISLESVDGAHIENVVIDNISMQDAMVPLFIRLSNRGRGAEPAIPGSIENISIGNIEATGATLTSSITGIPGFAIRDVRIEGFNVTATGRATKNDAEVSELPQRDPDSTMFGSLPSVGLYARHIEGLMIDGFHVRSEKPDGRPAIVVDEGARLTITRFVSSVETPDGPVILFRNVSGALLSGIQLASDVEVFLGLSGHTSGIQLEANDLRRARNVMGRFP
jgi:Glycosyl hydrolases family 28/Pectate lyase superfamily protein